MSKVPTLEREPNGIIYMRWTDPSPVKGQRGRSRRRTTGTSNMDEAKTFLGKFLLLEKSHETPGKTLTVGDLWTIYDEKHVDKVVAPFSLRSAWKNLEKHFGALTLSEVNDDTAETYQTKRESGVIGLPSMPSTIRRELIVMKACFNWCAKPKRKIITKADVPDFDLPPEGEPGDRWLTLNEHQALLKAAAELRQEAGGERMSRAERFLWLAHETAARKTAICQLTWPRVDFETNVIDYNVPGRRRTKKRRGVVPISKALRPVLLRMYEERLPDCDLVMDTETNVWEIIHTVAKRAGVPDVSPHVLRHTAATHMARRGVPIFKIAKILAITVATAERVYAKHAPEDLREAVDTISQGVLEAAE